MKHLYFCIGIFIIHLFTSELYTQNFPDWAWKLPITKVYPADEYYNLPAAMDNVKFNNPNATTRVFNQNGKQFVLPPNIRPFPHTSTQSEVEAANMKGNTNIMYAAWVSYGPAFYGCGFAFTSNGGASWSGSHQTYMPNSGDPGPWIWPAGSTWAGRLGLSCIGGAGYSTNNGTSWVFAMNFPGAAGFDKNLSAVDDISGSPYFGRAYTVWTNFIGVNANRIMGSYSTNGGVTWDTASVVSPVPASGHFNLGCDIEVGPGGVVYVVWAHSIVSGQNSTEDNLGFAKSTNGGESWTVSNNNVVDINGIRSQNLFNGIRVNGFPRIAVDNTGGARNGWIYVTMAEKDIAPATDLADITFCRSTDGGTTWNHTRVNQDQPGNNRCQYFSDIDVAPDGSVICSYYDQRNTSGFLTEYWLSHSTDGGNTWVDVAASDHSFIPAPISGLANGYQGDYTGITTCAGKIWPFWADNSSGMYQVWTAGITIIGIQSTGNAIPESYALMQNYPNPFNSQTMIEFSIPHENIVNIALFDIAGKEVSRIFSGSLQPGNYKVDFNASALSSGVYFYRLTADSYTDTKKMIIIK